MKIGSWFTTEDALRLSVEEYKSLQRYIRFIGFTAHDKWCGHDLIRQWSAVCVDVVGDVTCINFQYRDLDPELKIEFGELKRMADLGMIA